MPQIDSPLSTASDPIHVVLCFDAGFSCHAGVALFSLLASNPGRRFNVSLLSSGLSRADRARFEELGSTHNVRLVVHPIDSKR